MQNVRKTAARPPWLALIVLSLAASACSGLPGATSAATPAATLVPAASDARPAATPVSTVDPVPTPLPAATPDRTIPRVSFSPVPGDTAAVPTPILDAVIADAAGRTGAAPADITIVTARSVTWPNGALGCPQPGYAYTEMVEPGYQVVVDAGGTRLDYRIGSGGQPQLCTNPSGPG
jgi:hypothetical protein